MANTGHRGLLEIEIDNHRKKRQKIHKDNSIIDSLKKDKSALDEEENSFFLKCKNVFVFHIRRHTVNCK